MKINEAKKTLIKDYKTQHIFRIILKDGEIIYNAYNYLYITIMN